MASTSGESGDILAAIEVAEMADVANEAPSEAPEVPSPSAEAELPKERARRARGKTKVFQWDFHGI